jgi:cation transport regulator ChaC
MKAQRQDDAQPLWIFGYGSLVWRPAFPFVERRPGFIEHWSRRFWQGSTDHRGTPDQPGRVVTLVREPDAICWGVAFRVASHERERVLARLDHRERGGFDRHEVTVKLDEHRDEAAAAEEVCALVYRATPENPNYLGPAPLREIAAQVRRCQGPSGANAEYVIELATALQALGATDEHVFELASLIEADG